MLLGQVASAQTQTVNKRSGREHWEPTMVPFGTSMAVRTEDKIQTDFDVGRAAWRQSLLSDGGLKKRVRLLKFQNGCWPLNPPSVPAYN